MASSPVHALRRAALARVLRAWVSRRRRHEEWRFTNVSPDREGQFRAGPAVRAAGRDAQSGRRHSLRRLGGGLAGLCQRHYVAGALPVASTVPRGSTVRKPCRRPCERNPDLVTRHLSRTGAGTRATRSRLSTPRSCRTGRLSISPTAIVSGEPVHISVHLAGRRGRFWHFPRNLIRGREELPRCRIVETLCRARQQTST